jgi:dolichol-phosphate mannosyltransferase
MFSFPDQATRPPLSATLVSIVLPVYNEETVLQRLVDEVSRAVARSGARYEIVFVNDGSNDGSGRMLDALARENNFVRVVHLSRNFGHQAAVQAGLNHASGHCIVLMDSDMQDAPDAIPRFLDEWQSGYDVVYAVRADRKENVVKRMLFRGFYRFLSSISSTPLPLDAGNFGLVDRRVAHEIVSLGERDRYFAGLRSWVGFRQRAVNVERLARYDEHPRVSLLGLWRLANTAIFSFSTVPLRAFSLIGYTALGVFMLLGGFSLYCRLFTDLAIPGWTSGILSASFFGALNALGISILGEYVIRIYDQVRGRPVYIVDRTVNTPAIMSSGEPVEPSLAELARLANATRSCVEEPAVGVLAVEGDENRGQLLADMHGALTGRREGVATSDARANIVPPT